MLKNRDHSWVDFYQGDEESATSFFQAQVDYVPRVGEEVRVFTQRDEDGNYLNEHKLPCETQICKEVISGIVTRVVNIVEERGRSSNEHNWAQCVEVYVRKKS